MNSLKDIVMCIVEEYREKYNEDISEMKLHKLLYFAQRESFVIFGKPLLSETFYGWKYGPILKEVRYLYPKYIHDHSQSYNISNNAHKIIDSVFNRYASKDAWSLSRLTHGEFSWRHSRMGIPDNENSDNAILNDDIQTDAERIRQRRELLHQMGLGE